MMQDIGIRLILAVLCFAATAYFLWTRRQGERTGEMFVHIAVTFYRDKSPIAFQIASWAYVGLAALWAGVGVIALLPPGWFAQ